jgi:DNA-directed RNA polymerase I and III subunit RPAC1
MVKKINAELHCQKGIGKEHAKWSPVATASYRLLPEISILSKIKGEDAHKFAKCFPKGVVKIIKNQQGEDEAQIADARKDTVSREVLRHPEFKDKVALSRDRNYFIFNVESTGAYKPETIFVEALNVMIGKCRTIKNALAELDSGMEIDR